MARRSRRWPRRDRTGAVGRGKPLARDDRRRPHGARGARDRGRRGRRLRERGDARVPRRRRWQRLLHRDQLRIQVEHPVTEMLKASTWWRSRSDRERRAAGFHPGRRAAAGSRDRVPDQRRGPGDRLRAGAGTIERFNAPGGPASGSTATPTGLRGAAVLRLPARQARRVGADPRGGDRPRPRRAPRARHRRGRHQRGDPPRCSS